jgi:hypothetical protein
MTVYSTHGLFLTCTQKSHLYLHSTQIFNIHIVYKQFYRTPCKNNKKTRTYLDGQLLARGDEFPSTLVPYLITTAPPLAFAPLMPYPPLTLFTMMTSTITVRDNNNCSRSRWRAARGSKLMCLELIHGLFITWKPSLL